jgi:hypothetical protein
MSIDDILKFIKENSKTGDWRLSHDMFIRSTSDEVLLGSCPICWMGAKLNQNPERLILSAYVVGERLGLESLGVVMPIVNAADHPNTRYRDRLLEACHLTN